MVAFRISKWIVTLVILVSLATALFALYLPDVVSIYDGRRIVLLAILIFAPCWCVLISAGRNYGRWLFTQYLYVAPLVMIMLITAAFFETSEFRWIEPVSYSLYFSFVVLVGGCLSASGLLGHALKMFLLSLILMLFLYGVISLLIYSFFITGQYIKFEDVLPWGFVHIRYWSHLTTWVLPLLPLGLVWGEFRESALWRIAVWVTATVWWWLLFSSMARGSLLAIVLSSLLVALVYRSKASLWMKYSIGFMLSGAGLWFLLSFSIPLLVFDSQAGRDVYFHSSGRLSLWGEAFAMSVQNFPLGMGSQSWMLHKPMTGTFPNLYFLNHPHNMYLLWAAEYGWVFVIALVCFGVRMGILAIRRKSCSGDMDKETQILLVAFTASVLAASLHAGVSAVFIAPASMMVGLIVLALFWGILQDPFDGVRLNSDKIYSRIGGYYFMPASLLILMLVGAVWYSNQLTDYYKAMVQDREGFDSSDKRSINKPRFWFHGYFPHPEKTEFK